MMQKTKRRKRYMVGWELRGEFSLGGPYSKKRADAELSCMHPNLDWPAAIYELVPVKVITKPVRRRKKKESV